MLFDSHAHLNDARFDEIDRKDFYVFSGTCKSY